MPLHPKTRPNALGNGTIAHPHACSANTNSRTVDGSPRETVTASHGLPQLQRLSFRASLYPAGHPPTSRLSPSGTGRRRTWPPCVS